MATKKAAKKQADRPKRPRDPNQFAHALIQEMTDRLENPATPEPAPVSNSDISRVMAELGRRGGKIGGKKRLETLSQERRSSIAFKAAQARWAKKTKA